MRTLIYSVFDKKTGVYGQPFFLNHETHAIRAVQQAANDLTTSIGQYPGDYALYCLGNFDDASGGFDDLNPQHVIEITSLVYNQPLNDGLFSEENE